MIRYIILILWVVFFYLLATSCSVERRAQRHLTKAKEHLVRVEQLDPSVKQLQVDTVITTEIKTDTVFQSQPGDTVLIEKDKLHIKYIKLPGDSVYIEGKCDADTVIVETPVFVPREVPSGLEKSLVRVLSGYWWVLLIIIFSIVLIKKIFN